VRWLRQERLAGLENAKAPGMILKIVRSSHWTEEGCFRAVSSWLQLATSRNQPICAVAAQNDSVAIGARKAFDAEKLMLTGGKWSEVSFLGVDGFPALAKLLSTAVG
jgi:ribose transport system substrate-binding protein